LAALLILIKSQPKEKSMTINIHVLDHTGHTSHTWDSENPVEVDAARSLFNSLTGKGYRAFKRGETDRPSSRMDTFDPSVEEMTFVPQLRGG
jgi:hypothetical protein